MLVQVGTGAFRRADDILKDVFATLGCEPWGGPSINGWSTISDLQRCARLYQLKRIRKVRVAGPGGNTLSLDIGSYTHAALAAHYAAQLPDERYPGFRPIIVSPYDIFDKALEYGASGEAIAGARSLYEGYVEFWGAEDLIPVAVEMAIGREERHTSRLDLLAHVEGGLRPGLWIIEHKSASSGTDFDAWRHDGEIIREFKAWLNLLQSHQLEWLKHKAQWERRSLMAIASEYGVPDASPDQSAR